MSTTSYIPRLHGFSDSNPAVAENSASLTVRRQRTKLKGANVAFPAKGCTDCQPTAPWLSWRGLPLPLIHASVVCRCRLKFRVPVGVRWSSRENGQVVSFAAQVASGACKCPRYRANRPIVGPGLRRHGRKGRARISPTIGPLRHLCPSLLPFHAAPRRPLSGLRCRLATRQKSLAKRRNRRATIEVHRRTVRNSVATN